MREWFGRGLQGLRKWIAQGSRRLREWFRQSPWGPRDPFAPKGKERKRKEKKRREGKKKRARPVFFSFSLLFLCFLQDCMELHNKLWHNGTGTVKGGALREEEA